MKIIIGGVYIFYVTFSGILCNPSRKLTLKFIAKSPRLYLYLISRPHINHSQYFDTVLCCDDKMTSSNGNIFRVTGLVRGINIQLSRSYTIAARFCICISHSIPSLNTRYYVAMLDKNSFYFAMLTVLL